MLTTSILSNTKITVWALTALLSLVLCVVGAFAKWTSDTFIKHDERITNETIELVWIEEGLRIEDAKLNILLHQQGVAYNGPELRLPPHPPFQGK